jgi:EAL domain-containing protein (putative c-di-GMP-specific phosphodiesterase class I)/ActR/RegA family two-component response regulator
MPAWSHGDAVRGRLLILDDDEAVGATLGRLAKRMGMETRVVTRSALFFREIDAWAPTHLALDLVMPDMDGVQVLRLLAERDCRSMIIITSGIGSRVLDAAQRSAEEYRLNIAGILSKPFDSAVLRELLERQPYRSDRPPPTPIPSSPIGRITETDLRQAIVGRQLELVYQPKIACATGRVAGFEALVRWRRPTGEVVMPDMFIPLAERSELIDGLTEQVCDMALRWIAGRPDSAALTMSVNFSARNLKDARLADNLSALCAELDLAPGRVIVELTETSAMEDPLASLALLTRLRVRGFQLSIDDFGTGYSSMMQLVRLPFSEMKVDKSLVIDAARSEEACTVIKSIVDLGHSLGLVITAEGVEDAETLAFLDAVRCDLAQGYHIARPMPGEEIAAWIAGR